MTIKADKDAFGRSKCPQCHNIVKYSFSSEETSDLSYPYIAYCSNCTDTIIYYLSNEELPFSRDEKRLEHDKKLNILYDQAKIIIFSIAIYGPSFQINDQDGSFDPKREYKFPLQR